MTLGLPQLCLIRHGETAWSLSGQHTGKTDLPLTDHGITTARALQPYLASTSFALVLTSPLLRARETCDLAGLGAQAQIAADLSEWDYGTYEGRTSAEISVERPGWSVCRDGCPGGETPKQVSERADRLIAGVRAVEGTIALFSHGQFGAVLAARWIGLDIAEAVHFALAPASVSILGPKPGHPHLPAICQWNAGPSAAPRESANGSRHAPS
ncbi:histidine phosphatase family protein [Sphingomonas sp. PAMC 26621]|uniref:histidine phosphatase family protein n=1 Tax=Sphingomonas sp. PAMC 26621 TaxID=1112213 RepID=UPI000288D743|nr:histidine phosphatase family protein [Sphingomonas sp. PAMC 26621]